jgi:WD40 repeat protein
MFLKDGFLWATDSQGNSEPRKLVEARPFDTVWDSDTSIIVYERIIQTGYEGPRRQDIQRIKRVFLSGKTELLADHIPKAGELPKYTPLTKLKDGSIVSYEDLWSQPVKTSGRTERKIKVFYQGNDLKGALKQLSVKTETGSFGDIILESFDGSIFKKVTSGQDYLLPVFSREQTKIATNNTKGEIVVLDLDGNVLSNLGRGELRRNCWSKDSDFLVYVVTEEDGHFVLNSDIFITDVEGKTKKHLTDTPDEKEGNYSWSPDGKKVAYSTGGKIYVCIFK